MDSQIGKNQALENLTFDASYFADEVREGFYISSMMKRYWAAQLTVLKEVNRVCRKYNIPWFADCGTLLGAVRHGGFIPWDDDLDICMLRHDWIRFFEVAKDEMPKDYCILNLHAEKEYEQVIGRIVNAHAINFSEAHMREFHGCPYTVGIDIFPLDGLCEDEGKEEKRRKMAASITEAMDLINAGKMDTPGCRRVLADIERQNHTTLHRRGNIKRELLLLAERIYTMYPSGEAEHVALMPFWVSDHNHKYHKNLFRDRVMLPFENTYMPVPARYDEVLRIEYGDYMAIHKGSGIHEYPVYKEQEEILKKNRGENPYRYTLTKKTALPVRNTKTLSDQCHDITDTLMEAHGQIMMLTERGNVDAALQLLEGCQGLAIRLGTLLEERISGSEEVVHMLEEYCELVYRCGENPGMDNVASLDESIENIRTNTDELMKNRRKEILFLPCKKSWWGGVWSLRTGRLLRSLIPMSM